MDQQQRALFYDGYKAALREDCKSIEPTPAWAKVVGKMLFPEIADPVEAGRRLNDKTNSNRDDRLSDDQERLIMRLAVEKRGYSAAHDYISDEIGMERGRPKERKDEARELLSRGEALLTEMKSVTERFERVVRSPLAVVDSSSKKSAA
jgi:hypothetical protein